MIVVIALGICIFSGIFGTKGIKGDVLETYKVNNTNLNVIIKENTIVSADNESNILYEIKNIKPKDDDNYNFDLYSDDVKKAECTTNFTGVLCLKSNGVFFSFNKD